MKRKSISKKLRFEIFKKNNFTCQYCGKSSPDIILEVDHILPISKGGTNDLLNLITSCFDCNRGKSDIKLDNKNEIKKQSKELKLLMDKNEQLEMLLKYRDEIKNINDKEVDIFNQEYKEYYPDEKLSDCGKELFKKIIKKYGIAEVLECLSISYDQYSDKYDSSYVLNMVERIAKNRKLYKNNPEIAELYYCRGILKNRFSYINEWQAMVYIKKLYYDAKITTEEIKELCIVAKNWTDFKNRLINYIEV
jgi:hypothetical protein